MGVCGVKFYPQTQTPKEDLYANNAFYDYVKDMKGYPYNLELATKKQLLNMLHSLGIITANDYEKHKKYFEELKLQIERWRKEEEKTAQERELLKKEIDEWQKKNAEDNRLIALLDERINQLKLEIEELYKK